MNNYEITYQTETTPITLEIEADDPYSACMILGRKTKSFKTRILKIIEFQKPEVIYNEKETRILST